jgi:hypothetical protein
MVNGCKQLFQAPFFGQTQSITPEKVFLIVFWKTHKSAKQKKQKWQPGSAKAQLGINHHFW